MNCPVTCGRPTRMSAETFKRMCAARRDDGGGRCATCGGRPERWPDELTTIEGGEEMGKTIKEQIAEALAPVQAELEEKRARIFELEAEAERMEADRSKLMDLIQEQSAELAAFRSAEHEPAGITGVEVLDMSANLYRDALADFAIRVLSGGVAVSFREPTA